MSKEEQEHFDLEAVHDEQISPLMTKIIAICNEHQLPMVASFNFENQEEKGNGLCTTVLNNFKGRIVPEFVQASRALHNRPAAEFVAITMVGTQHDFPEPDAEKSDG